MLRVVRLLRLPTECSGCVRWQEDLSCEEYISKYGSECEACSDAIGPKFETDLPFCDERYCDAATCPYEGYYNIIWARRLAPRTLDTRADE